MRAFVVLLIPVTPRRPAFAASTAGRCLLPVQQPAAMHSSGEASPPYLTDDVEAGEASPDVEASPGSSLTQAILRASFVVPAAHQEHARRRLACQRLHVANAVAAARLECTMRGGAHG